MFQFPPYPPRVYGFNARYPGIPPGGFPHSEISGSKLADSSPELIAVNHVLHRLLAPRHPPYALSSLIHVLRQIEAFAFCSVIKVLPMAWPQSPLPPSPELALRLARSTASRWRGASPRQGPEVDPTKTARLIARPARTPRRPLAYSLLILFSSAATRHHTMRSTLHRYPSVYHTSATLSNPGLPPPSTSRAFAG